MTKQKSTRVAGKARARAAVKSARADEIASIENLIADLQDRLRNLNGNVRQEAVGASGDVNDFVSESLAGIMERVRAGSEHITEDVADQAAKASQDAFKWIGREIEQHPLVLLGLAAGVGFLFGMARR
jgi:ElaB/YqjD/DUF883 family membrane-anchored ribosome-binding protein